MSETSSVSSIEEMGDLELHSSWDVYFSRNDVADYDERLVYVTTFNTIKGFWGIYQHLKLPSHLRQGCDYMFFRTGIQPYWEAAENKKGGRLLLEIKKVQRNAELNNKWLETLLALIGEQLSDNPEDVNGAIVQSRRQQDRISVWTRRDDETTRRIGYNYQRLVQSSTGLKFQSHGNRTSSINLRYSFHIGPRDVRKVAQNDKEENNNVPKRASVTGN